MRERSSRSLNEYTPHVDCDRPRASCFETEKSLSVATRAVWWMNDVSCGVAEPEDHPSDVISAHWDQPPKRGKRTTVAVVTVGNRGLRDLTKGLKSTCVAGIWPFVYRWMTSPSVQGAFKERSKQQEIKAMVTIGILTGFSNCKTITKNQSQRWLVNK